MVTVEIYGNDLKSLLLLKKLKKTNVSASILAEEKFNFDTSYTFQGHTFDCGYHAVEINRDDEVWGLISSEDINFNKMKAHRRLYVSSKFVSRNYTITDLSDMDLNSLYLQNEEQAFEYFWVNYVENQFIKSYTLNLLWRDFFKLNKNDYIVNIAPWLYPKEFLPFVDNQVKYHFEGTNNKDNLIAYPSKFGFGAIQDTLRNSLKNNICGETRIHEAIKSFQDLDVFNSNCVQRNVLSVIPIDIIKLLVEVNISIDIYETKYLIVDVELEAEIYIDFTELLVADPTIFLDRVSSTDVLTAKNRTAFLQLEKEVDANEDLKESTHKMISGLEVILSKDGHKVPVKKYQVKSVPFRRFDNAKCKEAVDILINQIEQRFTNLIVLNRSLLYRNFVDTYRDLKECVEKKINYGLG